MTIVLAVTFDQQAVMATDRSHFDGAGTRRCDYEDKRARFGQVLVGVAGLLEIGDVYTMDRVQALVAVGGALDVVAGRIRDELRRSLRDGEQVTPFADRFLTVVVAAPLARRRVGIRRLRFWPGAAALHPPMVDQIDADVDSVDPAQPQGWACCTAGDPPAALEAERYMRATLRGRQAFQHKPLRLAVAAAIDVAVRRCGPHPNPAFGGQPACCGTATMVGWQ